MSDSKENTKQQQRDSASTEEELLNSEEETATSSDKKIGETTNETSSELLQRLNEAEESANLHKEKYFRVMADLENFRRRVAKEKEELRDFAIASVIEDLLPAMDNLRLGLKAAEQNQEAKSIAEGFRMVGHQLIKTLENYGLEEHNPTGENFDPNLHDCMSHQPDEKVEEGIILETIRPGYQLKTRLIRPASVIVSSGNPSDSDSKNETAHA